MKYRPEQEEELITDLLAFSHDPEGFVQYAYPWGERGTPLENFKGPRGWQREVLQEVRNHTIDQTFSHQNGLDLSVFREAVASGRGIGKSALFGMLAHWHHSTHLGAGTLFTANTEGQLRSRTFPEIGRWIGMSINSHWYEIDALKIYPKAWLSELVQEQLKINPLYWVIQGANWSEENPDAFAGMHNSYGLLVAFDEASGIPKAIGNVTQGFFTEVNPFRYWIMFSNPRRNSGMFYDLFHDPNLADLWRTRQIDARQVEGSDQSVYQAIIQEHGEFSDTARVEVFGQFPEAGEDQFITNPVVRQAQQRELPSFDNGEPLIMGVDPAPRGRTVIRFRQGRDARSIPPVVLNGVENVGIANKVLELVDKYNPDAVAIDAGNGTGVIDILRRSRVKVFEVWFGAAAENSAGEFATLGSELWGHVRDWLPGGCIDGSETLFRDLTSRTWKWFGREDGKKILESKKNMAREGVPSPDDGDALALTFYPRVPRRDRRAMHGASGGVHIAAGLDDPILS